MATSVLALHSMSTHEEGFLDPKPAMRLEEQRAVERQKALTVDHLTAGRAALASSCSWSCWRIFSSENESH